MTLINCPECDNSVSDTAAACPKCGAPVSGSREHQAAGAPLTTIQETSKKLKTQLIYASLLILIGVLSLLASFSAISRTGQVPVFPMILLGAGLVWLISTKLKMWWHHK